MKEIYLLLLFLLLSSGMSSQVLSGTVVDDRNVPLYGANVFIDGSTIATSTDKEGHFSLNLNSRLNIYLVVSFVGFQTQYISKYEAGTKLRIVLKEDLNALDEVVVKPNQRFSRKEKLKIFREQFLGTTTAGKKATIVNEADIRLSYDEKTFTLTASSAKPLIVINPYLGYKIYYSLVDFQVSFSRLSIQPIDVLGNYFAGVSRFEETENSKKTIKRREEIYQGSPMQFFRSLSKGELEAKRFVLFEGKFMTHPDDCFSLKDTLGMTRITVFKKKKDFEPKKFVAAYSVLYNKKKQSKITFNTGIFYIDPFGNYSDTESILFAGELSKVRTADLLPLNYGIE